MPSENEKLFMLRLWQDDNDWRVSLKNIHEDQAAQYFHSIESFIRHLNTQDQNPLVQIETSKQKPAN